MSNIRKTSEKSNRFLSWTCVIYPESLPTDWVDKLGDLMIPWACSPLHDKDKNEDGTDKKPHYHLLLSFRSVKSYEQVKAITDTLNAPRPEPVRDTRGMVRYFLHLDNPSKAQYERQDIKVGGGFDLDTALQRSKSEDRVVRRQILNLLAEYGINEYCDAVDLIDSEYPDFSDYVFEHTFFFSAYLKSKKYKQMQQISESKRKTK